MTDVVREKRGVEGMKQQLAKERALFTEAAVKLGKERAKFEVGRESLQPHHPLTLF